MLLTVAHYKGACWASSLCVTYCMTFCFMRLDKWIVCVYFVINVHLKFASLAKEQAMETSEANNLPLILP